MMQEMWMIEHNWSCSRDSDIIIPNGFKAALSKINSIYRGSDQHDAQEFLRQLLSALQDEMKASKASTKELAEPKG